MFDTSSPEEQEAKRRKKAVYKMIALKYCGVETDIPHVSLCDSGVVLAPLAALVPLPINKVACLVTGRISPDIDLDSEDESVRIMSETKLKQEIELAASLSLPACVLPPPKSASCTNYARCTHHILRSLNINMELWLRIPLMEDSWELWDAFRARCDYHTQLLVALDVPGSLPSKNSGRRWLGEPLTAVILQARGFQANEKGSPCLPPHLENLVYTYFDHHIKVVISGDFQQDPSGESFGIQRSPFWPYLDYTASLFPDLDRSPEQGHARFQDGTRDRLQSSPHPLADTPIVIHARDVIKYNKYREAVYLALLDRDCTTEEATVLLVVGNRAEPLVRASLQAARDCQRKIKVFAFEKYYYEDDALHRLKGVEGHDIVTIISTDIHLWDSTERADILVSDFLGSFGDNEMSPERINGGQRFLKEDGISIPSSYTSFIEPVTALKIHNDMKSREDFVPFETAYYGNLHKVGRLTSTKSVFTFTHNNRSADIKSQQSKELEFDLGSALVHGFIGYFKAELYTDVYLSIEPSTATEDMFTWFPIFFPLNTPVQVKAGTSLKVSFWRCFDSTKVWYEWCVSSSGASPIHSSKGYVAKDKLPKS